MTTSPMPPIVDIDSWKTSLEQVQAEEEALMEQVVAIAASRRRLPMTPALGNYTFVGEDGNQSLADLFESKQQLVVYHFMYAPDWENGCAHCTQYARNHGGGINDELGQRDTRYVLISRAPYGQLKAWAQAKGIVTPWYSAPTAFSEEMGAINESFGDIPGISVFIRDDENNVYRTYSTHGVAIETTMPASGMLRMTPYGMQEKGEDSPKGWPQRFDPMG